jgi:hypothetical protein
VVRACKPASRVAAGFDSPKGALRAAIVVAADGATQKMSGDPSNVQNARQQLLEESEKLNLPLGWMDPKVNGVEDPFEFERIPNNAGGCARDGRVDVLEGKKGGLKEKLQDEFDMSASGVERLASRLRPGQERGSRACGASTFLKYSSFSCNPL